MTTENQEHAGDKHSLPPPTGTLFVMIVYLAALAATWALMFTRLLGK
jgi:hypothetical protein